MAFKLKSPLHNGDKKSTTPQVDKFMKMNERPSKELHKSIGGYSPLHPIEKANLAIHKGLDIVTLGYAGPRNRKLWSDTADEKERAEARKSISPVNAYMDDADASKLKQAQHSSSYTGPKNMITADGVNTQLTQDDKITTVGGDDPFSGYSKDSFKKKNEDDTPVPTDAEMKNTFDQFLFDNKEELDKLEQDAQNRKKPLYPSQKVEKRTWDNMRPGKDQLVDVDKYRKKQKEKEKREQAYQATPGPSFEPKEYNDNPPFMMKKKQLTKTGAGKAHNMSALQYNQEQLMSNLSGAGDQPSQADLDAMKALLSLQNSEGMSSSPMNQNGDPMKKMKTEKAITGKIPKSGTAPYREVERGEKSYKEMDSRKVMDREDGWSKASQTNRMQQAVKDEGGFADFKATNAMEKRYSGRKVPTPLNQNGGPGDPPKREKKIEGVKKKPSYRLMQGITSTGDTTSYEMVPGKTTMTQWGTNADGTPRIIPTTDYTKRKISNEEYNRRMKGSPANNKDLRKMKRDAKKKDKAQTKAKRKAGTLDSSDFANQPYRTLKGKF